MEMKLTHNLVLYCTWESNIHSFCRGFLTALCLQTIGDFVDVMGVDLYVFPTVSKNRATQNWQKEKRKKTEEGGV